jgi:predicted xylose isomerase-like sugar epimerase
MQDLKANEALATTEFDRQELEGTVAPLGAKDSVLILYMLAGEAVRAHRTECDEDFLFYSDSVHHTECGLVWQLGHMLIAPPSAEDAAVHSSAEGICY